MALHATSVDVAYEGLQVPRGERLFDLDRHTVAAPPRRPGRLARKTAACTRATPVCMPAGLTSFRTGYAPTLWEIELAGPIVEARHKVVVVWLVAPEHRRIPRGGARAGSGLGVANLCRAVATLPPRGATSSPIGSPRATTPRRSKSSAPTCVDDDGSRGSQAALMAVTPPTSRLRALSSTASSSRPTPPYAAADFDAGFAAERRFQAGWLVQRLAVDVSN